MRIEYYYRGKEIGAMRFYREILILQEHGGRPLIECLATHKQANTGDGKRKERVLEFYIS